MTTPSSTPPAAPSTPLPPQEESKLIALFNAGRHAELEAAARELTRKHPQSGFAWKALGTAQLVQKKDCVNALSQAAALLPTDAETLSNLGNAQKARGQMDAAEASYRQALQVRPDHAPGHYNLGLFLAELGRTDEAEAAYRKAVQLQPGLADAHNNLGLLLDKQSRNADATEAYSAAVAARPDHADAWCNLGASLAKQGQLAQAQAALRQALALNPRFAEAHLNLGLVFTQKHQHDEAYDSLRTATKLNANSVEARHALGDVLRNMRRYDEAILMLKRTLSLAPQHVDAWVDLGNVHKDLGELSEAVSCYERALDLAPDHEEAQGSLLMTRNYLPGMDGAALLQHAQAYGAFVRQKAHTFTDWPNALEPDKPLRIGLVSGDLYQHPVGYFLEGVLAAWQAQSVDGVNLTAYATQPYRDALSDRLAACVSAWHSVVGVPDEALAKRIRADGIDILIDLSGHTAHNRLPMFAWKPAPVQLSWLGYFATTGVPQMDYLLADPHTLPEALDAQFTERIWRLPETRLCFTAPATPEPVAVSPLPALRNGHVTFGCFNNLTKVNDEVMALWVAVLQAVPGSKLLLKAPQLGSAQVRQSIQTRFKALGLDVNQRLILQGPSTRSDYLAAYSQIDVALDPFPFTGGTTSAEGLWMGVPVLTLAGGSMVARQGVSLMVNAGLPEWVAHDRDDYVAKAALHAADLASLAQLRSGLRDQVTQSPVFDAPRFAKHLNTALRGMWQAHCSSTQNHTT